MPSLGVELILIIKHTKFKLIRKIDPLLMEENYQAQTKRQQQYYLGKLHCFNGIEQKEAHVSSRWPAWKRNYTKANIHNE